MIISNYPPLYPILLAGISKLFGLSLATGRLITMFSTIFGALFIGLIIRKLTEDRFAALVGASLFLAFPFVVFWARLVRVDMLALMLMLAALVVLVCRTTGRWSLGASVILMVAACLTRQSYLLAGPLAATVWLGSRDRTRAFQFALLFLGSVLTAFLFLNLVSQGGAYSHLVTANINLYSPGRMTDFFVALLVSSIILFPVAVIELVRLVRTGMRSEAALPLLVLAGGCLSAMTQGKIGSNMNYMLEAAVGFCLVGGTALAGWRKAILRSRTRLLLYLLFAAQGFWLVYWAHMRLELEAPRLHMASEVGELASIIESDTGPILADEYMSLMIPGGHEIVYQPFEFSRPAPWRAAAERRLRKDVLAGRFTLILISDHPPFGEGLASERWSAAIRQAIRQAYRPSRVLAGTTLYRPLESNSGSLSN
jgi:4-amino-4-deoxy-L-arabinose transferase-like glycosyltransferase